ncbi:MAG: PQQ-dependent sugar dehydrogenase, partial [Burkholderiales bacterium]
MTPSYARTAIAIVLLIATAAVFPAERRAQRSENHDFAVQTLVSGLQHPWSIAWLPDGRMLVTERAGRLRIVSADFKLDRNPVEGLPRIVVGDQGGLFDVALHPDYRANGWIYISYSGPGDGGHGTELMRAKLSGSRLTQQQVLFRLAPKTGSGQHFGGRIVFDEKGHVYLTL